MFPFACIYHFFFFSWNGFDYFAGFISNTRNVFFSIIAIIFFPSPIHACLHWPPANAIL